MGKTLSIFIDESGDVGFIKDASKYYIITFVIHNQSDDIKNNIEKIKNYPTFHAGPIIRREYPFDNMEMKDFNGDLLKMQAKITKDVYHLKKNYIKGINKKVLKK